MRFAVSEASKPRFGQLAGDTSARCKKIATGAVNPFVVAALSVALYLAGGLFCSTCQAQLKVVEQIQLDGVVGSVSAFKITVKDQQGKTYEVRVMDKKNGGVPLASGVMLKTNSTLKVAGIQSLAKLTFGDQLRIEAQLKRSGVVTDTVTKIESVGGMGLKDQIEVVEAGETSKDAAKCQVIGSFMRKTGNRIVMGIPKENGFVVGKSSLSFQVAKDAQVTFESDDCNRATAGSKVTGSAVRLNTGDVVAVDVNVIAGAAPEKTAAGKAEDKRMAAYRHLSDEPKKKPRIIRSQHAMLLSDVSDRQAKIVLDNIEAVATVLNKYFQRSSNSVVEGFIVHDLNVWPSGTLREQGGIAKIKEGAGVCFNSSLGAARRAVLYSCSDIGTIRHEFTHGYCHLTFGSTGPTWFAEGFAEMANYWNPLDPSVTADPVVVGYIKNAEKKQLLEIALPGNTPSGTWHDYAWRYALCHMLASNPNYSLRFKPMAVALMEGRDKVSFESVYGPVAKQVSFEYDLFLNTFDVGYRDDLCAWDWKTQFKPLVATGAVKRVKVKAKAGWQASGALLKKGASYEVTTSGNWKVDKAGGGCDGDGEKSGNGRLVGVLFDNYKLSKPIDLGKKTSFVAPADGELFLRCQDTWSKLDDNDGELVVDLQVSR